MVVKLTTEAVERRQVFSVQPIARGIVEAWRIRMLAQSLQHSLAVGRQQGRSLVVNGQPTHSGDFFILD
jgi:hypothetical protein